MVAVALAAALCLRTIDVAATTASPTPSSPPRRFSPVRPIDATRRTTGDTVTQQTGSARSAGPRPSLFVRDDAPASCAVCDVGFLSDLCRLLGEGDNGAPRAVLVDDARRCVRESLDALAAYAACGCGRGRFVGRARAFPVRGEGEAHLAWR
jgi:hypothetical protein